jgi:SHS2 domain-containing protein
VYRVRRHDDRIEVEIEDETPEAVFREAIVALADEITEERGGGEPLAHRVDLEASNLSDLLRVLLDELLRLERDDFFIGERAARLALAGASLRAVVGGQRLEHEGTIASVDESEVFQAEDATWHARLVLARK